MTALGEKLSELWATADGASSRPRGPRRWPDVILDILEIAGDPPPDPDAVPPDQDVTLGSLLRAGDEWERSLLPKVTAELEATRVERRSTFDFEAYRRDHADRKARHAGAWMQFRRRHDPDIPPAA